MSSGAARVLCTWSCHGRRRTSTSWARTAALLIACLRSSISTPAASCPLRAPNTCPCSTPSPSGHYSALGHLRHSVTHCVAPVMPCRLMGRRKVTSSNCWSRFTSLADRPAGLLALLFNTETHCCRSFIILFVFYLWHPLCYIADWLSDDHHFIVCRSEFP